ncbi:A/G-specific adenine glycosylase [Pelosinus baikalensis]|uniref:Adenine DNA glycosylase n=1 Tax=Pelosinus baikalensis TaxID=2892015 RepID=A0ABS8HKZ4_9FIRM|nr:A/G-specific adenine glycosylase [Pelosinus baikalensis]MCC5463835.1 A/G-specific adenine glycosylase [Pelosinus baikalensis]
MKIAQLLLTWYENSKRDLPWRRDKDPYRIWVSEIMLQQTRVEAVKPYFDRWMERFPDLESLAEAEEEEVVRHWQGLGYYSRARNLLQGVREVSQSYGGQVPQTKEEVIGLAGVGDYTAGAILSIAYNKKEPAIDGNVLRVFSRLFCVEEEISSPAAKKVIKQLVADEMSEEHPGDFNQALMDLGSSICIPKTPRCTLCPLADCCCAKRKGKEGQLPVKKKKAPPKAVRLMAGVIRQGEFFLLHQRPNRGLLAGMWEFPTVEIGEDGEAMDIFRQGIQEKTGQVIELERLLLQCTHIFSHRQWDISFYYCIAAPDRIVPNDRELKWVNRTDWEKLSFAGPHRKMEKYLAEKNSQESWQSFE